MNEERQRVERLEEMARGPRGTLYRGVDLADGERPVTLKAMPQGAVDEAWLVTQQRLMRLNHPSLVPMMRLVVFGLLLSQNWVTLPRMRLA